MNVFRRGLRKIVHYLGSAKILSPLYTMQLLHLIDLGRWPNLKHPRDLNEKLMWLEHNSDTSEWTRLADKNLVRDYVKEKGYGDKLIPLIGVYNSVDEIDFSQLPSKFVIKPTNGCGETIIIDDKEKFTPKLITEASKRWFKKPFGLATGEKHYLSIKPRIIIEEMLPIKCNQLPVDYKFFCFNGKVESCLVVTQRNIKNNTNYKVNLMDIEKWKEIPDSIRLNYRGKTKEIQKPLNLKEMLSMVETLSQGFPCVRVDIYEENDKVYFGEMTFTNSGCRTSYFSENILNRYGDLIVIK